MVLGSKSSKDKIVMTQSNGITIVIYGLLFTSILFLLAGLSIRRRIKGRSKLFSKIFGQIEDLYPTSVKELSKPKFRINLEKFLPLSYKNSLLEKLSKSGKLGDAFLSELIKRKFIYAAGIGLVASANFLPSGSYFKLLLAVLFGFFLPDILVTNSIQKRAETISQALPDAVEMLTMCVEAGLSFQQSLKKVSENQNTVISNEFARVMSEIQIGEPRSVALSSMGQRLNHEDVQKFVSAMMQVDRLGIPISSVLREQVQELRSQARMNAREKAQKVPVKILGPVMACFMPCTLIIVLGPVILQFVG